MRKNILTIVIMALCLMNLVMTAIVVFTIVPTAKKTDALISQVASVINLELTGYAENSYKVENLEVHKIDEGLTKNLKPGEKDPETGKVESHFAVLDYVTLSINTKSEDYKELNEILTAQDPKIMDIVGTTLTQYTYDEAISDQSKIKEDILQQLRTYFGSADFIVDVNFGNFVCQ